MVSPQETTAWNLSADPAYAAEASAATRINPCIAGWPIVASLTMVTQTFEPRTRRAAPEKTVRAS